jgi:cell division topological specificity factor
VWNGIKNFFFKPTSSDEAKGRLHLVLAHDRTGLDGAKLQELRTEIADVLARYVAIDRDAVEIEVHRVGRGDTRLEVTSPLRARS